MTNSNEALRAAQRLAVFCDQWGKGRHNGDQIHGIGLGNGEEVALTVADIRTVVAALTPSPVAGGDLREAVAELAKAPAINWAGTEDQQNKIGMAACASRRKRWGNDDCDERDGSCDECHYDIAEVLETPTSMKRRLRAYQARVDRFMQSPALSAALSQPAAPVEAVAVGSGRGVIPDHLLDSLLDSPRSASDDEAFTVVWMQLEARGYLWSEGNVEKAHLGWLLARALAHPPEPAASTVAQGEAK